MLGAFAQRKDIRRAGLQPVVDDDAAIDGNAGVPGERDIRPDAGGEDHRIGLDLPSVRQFDAFDMRLAVQARGVGIEQNLDPLALDEGFQQFRGRRIELTLHQPVHQMNQRHRRAGLGETIGRFQSEQSAADHDDALLRGPPASAADRHRGCRERCGRRQGRRRARSAAAAVDPVASTSLENTMLSSLAILSSRRPTSISVAHTAIFQGDAALAPPMSGLELDVMRLRSRLPAPTTAARDYRRAAARRR